MKWADLGALFTPSEKTKLSGIDTGATDDQTGAEIKTVYEGEADTNAYDDVAVTKLAGIDAGADVTGSNPPQAHGASAHTDRERTVFLSNPHYHSGVRAAGGTELQAGAVDFANYYTILPIDFSSLISVAIIWRHSATPTATNIELGINTYYGASGEVYNAHTDIDLGNDVSANVAQYQIQTFTTSLSLTGITKNDFLRLKVSRDGDDTCGYSIYVLGILIKYTADM